MSASSAISAQKSPGYAIFLWAPLGAIFLLIQAIVFVRWASSDQFRATPVGSDPIPQLSLVGVQVYEVLSLVTLVPVLYWFINGIRQTGAIDNLRLMMIGWLSAYWLDPWLNFLRPMFTYNAYMFNRGCWCEFMPFWQSAHGSRIAEPLLVDAPAYFYTFGWTCWMAYLGMAKARVKWPGMGTAGLAFIGACCVWLTMGLLDIFATSVLYFDGWPGAFHAASFWGGTSRQFPIYEFVLFPSTFMAGAFLLLHAKADGTTVIEGGLDRLPLTRSGPGRAVARVLAFVAFANLCNLSYTTAMGVHALYVDPWPTMPSWLANGQCGGGTGIECR
jgi:hypothetical protein